jgi:hypothetical protein
VNAPQSTATARSSGSGSFSAIASVRGSIVSGGGASSYGSVGGTGSPVRALALVPA